MTGPLEGIRVLDLSAVIAGPMATQILGDQGADVIKIEAPGLGDVGRYLGPMRGGIGAMFATVNRSKRAVALNLKEPAGREALLRLVTSADVFVENFRPGVTARLGIGHDVLLKVNPRLVYVAMSGFGETGPYAKRRVYDPIIQATSGFADSQAGADGAPRLIESIVCDKLTALTAAQAICAALLARTRSGTGQLLMLNMLDATIAFQWPDTMYNYTFLGDGWKRMPDLAQFYDILAAKDGYLTIIVISDEEFRNLATALELPELLSDVRFRDLHGRIEHGRALEEIVAAKLATMTVDRALARLEAADVPAAAVLTRDAVPHDPQVRHNGTLVTLVHPAAGEMRQPRPAARFAATPAEIWRPAPRLGEHTDEVLREAGYAPDEIARLRVAGAAA